MSREALAREAWKESNRSDPLDNVLDSYIGRPRRKIDIDGLPSIIDTV